MTTHAPALSSSPPTSWRPFATFLWKELYNLVPLVLALSALGIVIQLAGLAARPQPQPSFFHGMAVTMAILFAIAAAGTRFAMEYEDGTRQWLLALPLSGWTVFLAKIGAIVVATVLTLLVLMVVAQYCIGALEARPGGADVPAIWQIVWRSAPILCHCVAWGIVFSLVLRRPLLAVLLTVVFLSFVQIGFNGWIPFFSPRLTDAEVRATAAEYWFSATAGLILSVVFGGHWLSRMATGKVAVCSEFTLPFLKALTSQEVRAVDTASRSRALVVLLWQTVRESWSYLLVGAIATILVPRLLVFVIEIGAHLQAGWLLPANLHIPTIRPALLHLHLLVTSAAAVYGSAVFAADHAQSKYRILGALPARPGAVWWARILIAILPIVGIAIAVIEHRPSLWQGSGDFTNYLHRTPGNEWWLANNMWTFLGSRDMTSAILAAICGGFAVGQLTSLLCRSYVIAGVIAVVAAVPLWLWGGALSVWHLPLVAFYLPIPILLMVVSRLRMGLLLHERSSWKNGAMTAVAIAFPLFAVVAVVVGLKFWTKDDVRPFPIGVPFYEQLQESLRMVPRVGDDQDGEAADSAIDVLIARMRDLPRSVGEFQVADVTSNIPQSAGPTPINLDEIARIVSSDEESPLGANDAIALSQQLEMPPPSVLWSFAGDQQLARIVGGLERRAGKLTRAGRLVDALEHMRAAMRWRIFRRRGSIWLDEPRDLQNALFGWIAWANQSDQSPELVIRARRELNRLLPTTKNEWLESLRQEPTFVPMAPAPIDTLYDIREALMHPLSLESRVAPGEFTRLARWLQVFPGEISRSLRLLDQYAHQEILAVGQLNEAANQMLSHRLANGGSSFDSSIAHELRDRARSLLTVNFETDNNGNIVHKREWSALVTNPMLQPMIQDLWWRSQYSFVVNQTIIRGAKLQLDLLAFRLEHGQLPVDLAELSKSTSFELPLQPLTNTPFEYWPEEWHGEDDIDTFSWGIVPWFSANWQEEVELGTADRSEVSRFISKSAPPGWEPILGVPKGPGFHSNRFYVETAELHAVQYIPSFLFPLELVSVGTEQDDDESSGSR